jgi:hypothetical protein
MMRAEISRILFGKFDSYFRIGRESNGKIKTQKNNID